jgi:hypothetical protein
MAPQPCPECKFENLPKQTVCLMCKAPLPPREEPTEIGQPTRAIPRAEVPALPEEVVAPSSSLSTTDVDLSQVIGWLSCEPLAPLPLVPGSAITIGRSPDCDLVLRSKAISRKHALVKGMGQDMQLEDLGSANGTFLNGKRTPRANLVSGDVITIGSYEIQVGSNEAMAQSGQDADMEGTQVIEAVQTESGFLGDGALLELLQGIEFNRKTGTIKLLSGSLRGTIVVEEGRPRWATLGGRKDEDAVYAMLAVPEGRYTFVSVLEPGEARMSGTITGLLLEASRRADMASEEAQGEDAEAVAGAREDAEAVAGAREDAEAEAEG